MRIGEEGKQAKMKITILILVLVCGLVAFAAENDLSGKFARFVVFETCISPWYSYQKFLSLHQQFLPIESFLTRILGS